MRFFDEELESSLGRLADAVASSSQLPKKSQQNLALEPHDFSHSRAFGIWNGGTYNFGTQSPYLFIFMVIVDIFASQCSLDLSNQTSRKEGNEMMRRKMDGIGNDIRAVACSYDVFIFFNLP